MRDSSAVCHQRFIQSIERTIPEELLIFNHERACVHTYASKT